MQINLLKALSDNYIFLLHEPQQNIAAVVDPAEAQPVLQQLKELETQLLAIFNTHYHHDHVGGNRQLIQQYPQVKVYGGAEDRGEFLDRLRDYCNRPQMCRKKAKDEY
jgi:hydroxyacylglutathione hydrolase